MDDEEITVQTVTINNRDNVRHGVNIIFDVNMDNDLEVCGFLSDSDILSYVRTVTSTQFLDVEDGQECTEPQPSPRLNKHRYIIMNRDDVSKTNQRSAKNILKH